MKLKDARTSNNLMKAFINECQASMRYSYYAKQAKEDGYVQIQKIFEETSQNEAEHAKRFYKFLRDEMQGEEIKITNTYPVVFDKTLENLKAAEEDENYEATKLYPDFSKEAEKEGFKEIAKVFQEISEVEMAHHNRYKKLVENIEAGKVFKRDEVYIWKCLNCGYLHEGKTPPKKCPACDHPMDFFEIFVENY